MAKELHFLYWPEQADSDIDFINLRNKISASERLAASQAKSVKRQSEIIMGRCLLRFAFHKFFDLDLPENLLISESGKPLPIHNIAFNLSHSKDTVGLVIGGSNELGLDIEFNNPKRNYLDIVKNFGSESELFEFNNTDPESRADKFYSQWSLKESFSKATGQGLNQTLKEIEFNLKDYTFKHNNKKPECYFQYLKIDEFHVSICHFSPDIFNVKAHSVSFEKNEICLTPMQVISKTII